MTATSHEPVLVERVTELLAVPSGRGVLPSRSGVLVDATVGAAGHAAALLAASGDEVRLVAFDRDAAALEIAQRRLASYGDRVVFVHAGYDQLATHVADVLSASTPLLGVLYDLGVSSMQLDDAERGFSFRTDAPLDMRMDTSAATTAADIANNADQSELTRILSRYGEERYSGRIARAIIAARPITTTRQLADVVTGAVPAKARFGPLHPATRTFQAIRIATNDELVRFSTSLPQALELAAPASSSIRGGRIAVLSYHSLEDRIAKRFFADAAGGCICPPGLPVCVCGRVPLVRALTRKAERPSQAEVERNARARSAKLRAVEKIADGPVPIAISP
jgi:16S rRNA (cytosine1402-N4)-methyltransferase